MNTLTSQLHTKVNELQATVAELFFLMKFMRHKRKDLWEKNVKYWKFHKDMAAFKYLCF